MTTPTVHLGEITVTNDYVYTPSGNIPLAGTRWAIVDMRTSRNRIPPLIIAFAVVLGVLLCGLGLLLLFITEQVIEGSVRVSVAAAGFPGYTTDLPVRHPKHMEWLQGTVAALQERSYFLLGG